MTPPRFFDKVVRTPLEKKFLSFLIGKFPQGWDLLDIARRFEDNRDFPFDLAYSSEFLEFAGSGTKPENASDAALRTAYAICRRCDSLNGLRRNLLVLLNPSSENMFELVSAADILAGSEKRKSIADLRQACGRDDFTESLYCLVRESITSLKSERGGLCFDRLEDLVSEVEERFLANPDCDEKRRKEVIGKMLELFHQLNIMHSKMDNLERVQDEFCRMYTGYTGLSLFDYHFQMKQGDGGGYEIIPRPVLDADASGN